MSTSGAAIAYERNFRWKIGQFRQLCSVCEEVSFIVLVKHFITEQHITQPY